MIHEPYDDEHDEHVEHELERRRLLVWVFLAGLAAGAGLGFLFMLACRGIQ